MTGLLDIELKLRVLCFRRVLFITAGSGFTIKYQGRVGWITKEPGGDTDTGTRGVRQGKVRHSTG